jgi:amino acid adenylation domain-containing protein
LCIFFWTGGGQTAIYIVIKMWQGTNGQLLEGTSHSAAFAKRQEVAAGVPALADVERHLILVGWNQTEREYPRDKCIHQLFEEQAERTPEAVAVVHGDRSISYRELNFRANQLARRLRSQGARPKDLTALCLDRSIDAVIGLLGILKTGGAYVPLDPAQPEERLSFLVENAGISIVLAQGSLNWRLPARARLMRVDSAEPPALLGASEESSMPAEADAVAYVMYTSGSTGNPKGVCVPHRAIARLVLNSDYVELGSADVVGHAANLAFDAATFEIWGALLNGARLEIISKDTLLAPERLATLLRDRRVNTLFLTTALFNLLGRVMPGIFKTLKQVLFGGEAADPYPVQAVLQNGPPQRLLHMYGPTETTTFATWQLMETLPGGTGTVPIGRPIANTTVYLLDTCQQPVPAGRPGEICIGGDGLACGYLDDQPLTAERFIPHPFSDQPGDRLYRTGDLALRRADGTIEFLGRLDSQVKIRGFRVELGEIEMNLRRQPEIREAVVMLREGQAEDKRLTAYLVPKTSEILDAPVLRARLAEKLPEYMVPNFLVWLDQMPLTPNGKVDRKALPAPETVDAAVKPGTPPINLLEWEFMRIWQRIFGRDGIGRQDNFFALGGHSLMAARLASETEKFLGAKLPIAALFQAPTIELLARRFLDEKWAPPWSSLVPLQPNGTKPPLFFVHGVAGDVFGFVELAGMLGPDQPSYGIQAVGLDGKSTRHVTVEEMAAHYVKEMISFQPDGPFSLAGYSLGGIIAYEIAQQLHRKGRRVALLAFLDCGPVGATPWIYYGLAMATYVPGRCWHHLRRWITMPRHEKIEYFQGRVGAVWNLVADNCTKPRLVTAPPPPNDQPPQLPIDIDYYHAIALPYQLRPYPGSMDLFVSDEAISGWQWYWRHLAGGKVSFHKIPGQHLEILSPNNLPVLAKTLATVLQRAQQQE